MLRQGRLTPTPWPMKKTVTMTMTVISSAPSLPPRSPRFPN